MSYGKQNKSNVESTSNRIILYLLFVLAFIGFITLFANKWVSEQSINQIVVKGNTFIPKNEILSLITKDTANMKIEDLSLLKLKQSVESHPFISKAFIIRKNSSIIEIEIEERKPIAFITNSKGNVNLVDEKACILPYRLSAKFSELPIIQGVYKGNALDSSALNQAIKLLHIIADCQIVNLSEKISEITYNKWTKEFSIVSTDKAYPIRLGKAKDLEKKINKLQLISKKYLRTINTDELSYIDLRWANKVVFKMNNEKYDN